MPHPSPLCRPLRTAALTGVVLTLLGLVAPRAAAAAQGNLWHFEQVAWKDVIGRGVQVGEVTYEVRQADLRGGRVRVTGFGGPPDNFCPGGWEEFLFTWSFDRDLTTVTNGETFSIRLAAERPRWQLPCNGHIASLSWLVAVADPIAFPEIQVSPGDLFGGPLQHVVPPFPTSTEPSGLLVPRSVTTAYSNADVPRNGFSLYIMTRGGSQLVFLYVYGPGPGDLLTQQAQRDILARAARDPRFGAVSYPSFGALLTWDPSWQLRWMDFAFTGGRVVRIYQATNIANPALRYTIFFDPDTNSWTAWEQAVG